MSKEFKIDVGNSATGPVGFVAYITAESKEHALELIKSVLPDHAIVTESPLIEVNVYFNANAVKITEIEEIDS